MDAGLGGLRVRGEIISSAYPILPSLRPLSCLMTVFTSHINTHALDWPKHRDSYRWHSRQFGSCSPKTARCLCAPNLVSWGRMLVSAACREAPRESQPGVLEASGYMEMGGGLREAAGGGIALAWPHPLPIF